MLGQRCAANSSTPAVRASRSTDVTSAAWTKRHRILSGGCVITPIPKPWPNKRCSKPVAVARLLTCSLRPHLIWGPRDPHLVPRLIERARRGRLRQIGDGTNLVDMVYVDNAAQAHLLAADALIEGSPVGGRAYFISQGEPINCWQWINDILALAGLPPVRKKISLAAARRIGFVLESVYRALRIAREPLMTRFLATQLATSHYFDITAARRDFGYRPNVSTQEGMRRLSAAIGP